MLRHATRPAIGRWRSPPTCTRNSSAESAGQEEDHPSLRAEVRRRPPGPGIKEQVLVAAIAVHRRRRLPGRPVTSLHAWHAGQPKHPLQVPARPRSALRSMWLGAPDQVDLDRLGAGPCIVVVAVAHQPQPALERCRRRHASPSADLGWVHIRPRRGTERNKRAVQGSHHQGPPRQPGRIRRDSHPNDDQHEPTGQEQRPPHDTPARRSTRMTSRF
jgi:hypothetical protein